MKSSSMTALSAPPSSKKKHAKLEPIEGQAGTKSMKRPMFTKKDLTEAVRRLTPGAGTTELVAKTPFSTTSVEASTRRGMGKAEGAASTPLALMEWGVNFNARKFNELRTLADRKAAALKARLDSLRALKMEQESLEKMLSPDSPDATLIDDLLRAIQGVNDETDRRLHYRRQLEHILRRLQKNQVTFDSHLQNMDEARAAAVREHKDMKGMTRQIEAGHTQAALELAEAQRLVAVERGERQRANEQRRTEAEQASRMDAWRQKREIARREFASELRGDLSQEEEQLLQARLTSQKAALAALRSEHEKLQKEANSLESAFVAVRQATGVNSLDEVVEKFLGQQGNRRALTTEKREAEERLGNAKRGKEEIEHRFSELKASGIGSTEMNREIAEQLEREIAAARVELKASNAGCERLEGVLVALRQGAVGLYQRLRPFGHLLEGEGALPTAAMLPGGIAAGGGGGGQGGGGPDAPAIDSIDAIHLSEIMLSKMVEIISGGEHGAGTSGIMNLHEATSPETDLDDDESAADEALPHPQNNIRVRSDAQQKEVDRAVSGTAGSFFITEGAEVDGAAGDGDGDGGRAEVEDDAAEDGVGLSVGLSDAAVAEALDDMVPSRTFLKLSSSRQHQEMIRRNEQDARKKRMLERIEMAEGAERAQMSSRAARKKAQTEANNRLSKMVKQGQPPPLSKTKDSAIERSMMFLKQVPELL